MNRCSVISLDFMASKKEALVKDAGIGSELRPHLFGFDRSDNLIGLVECVGHPGSASDIANTHTSAASIMRTMWGAETITFVYEAFVSERTMDEAPKESLANSFASGDSDVNEALVLSRFNQESMIFTDILPYKVEVGRKIKWLYNLSTTDSMSADTSFMSLIREAVQQNASINRLGLGSRIFRESIEMLNEQGFQVLIPNKVK